ncbi:MAG: hypothetical protein IKI68_04180 [Clostridia bacterium]|nr:hypothetical protein [Clostridia bacterium]
MCKDAFRVIFLTAGQKVTDLIPVFSTITATAGNIIAFAACGKYITQPERAISILGYFVG